MRVLVTGSQGTSAPCSARSCRARSRGGRPRHRLLRGVRLRKRPRPRADERATTSATSARRLEGFDAIVHLAALSNDPIGDLRHERDIRHQPRRDSRVARAAKEAGVGRFVFASSCSMYGAADGDELLDEDRSAPPADGLRRVEGAGGRGAGGARRRRVRDVSMRNATVYGASPRLRLDIVLNNLAGWAHMTGRIRLLSDGMSWRPLMHVRDLPSVALADARGPDDLVRGRGLQRRLCAAELLIEISQGCSPRSPVARSSRRRRVARSSLVPRRLLAARAGVPVARFRVGLEAGSTGARRRVPALPLTTELFEGRRYVRLRQLRHLLDSSALERACGGRFRVA